MRSHAFCVASVLVAAACLPGQIPAHAVVLNPSPSEFEPLLTQDGDTIHACGIRPDGIYGGFVHYSRSRDGGRTWPVREVPLGYSPEVLDLDADGDLVVVLVHSQFFGPHVITSSDGGTTWALPVRVSLNAVINAAGSARVHVADSTVNVIWTERRAAGGMIWANRSTDGGVTFRPIDRRLDVGTTVHPASSGARSLVVVAEGALLHALWVHDAITGPQTLHQTSSDGGQSWRPQPNVVTTGSMQAGGGDGNLLFVSRGSPLPDLRSTDGGASWSPVTVPGMLGWASVAVDGQNVLVTRGGGSFPSQTLLLSVSQDGGATWLPTPYVIVTSRLFVSRAHVLDDVLLVHVEFFDNQNPLGSVILSDDGGVSWRLLTDEAGYGLWPAKDRLMVTTVVNLGSTVTWSYVLAGHTTLGNGTPGTSGLVPRLDGAGLPALGRTFSYEVSDALGGSPGAVFASFAPAAPTPLGSATLHVQPPVVPLTFTTGPAGDAILQVAVPTSTAFAGLTLTGQAFVIDPAAVDGFTATRALETWIR